MRKRKNAFTLIELLAVIVILAIIALIATPIILGIVEDAKKDAFVRSVELLVSTTNIDIANKTFEEEYTYTITNGDISNLEVSVKNTTGMNGSITYDANGKEVYAIHNGTYCVRKIGEMLKAKISDYVEGKCVIPVELTENDITSVSFNDLEYTYDGTLKRVEVNNLPEGFTVTYTNNTGKNAGVYEAIAIINGNDNYIGSITKTATLTINKAPITIKAEDKSSDELEELVGLTYQITDGMIYNNDNLNIVLEKEEGTSSGEYDIIVSAENDNYEITKVNGIYTIISSILTYANGQRVYFDVYGGTGCTMEKYAESYENGDFANSLTGYNGLNGTGNQNNCLLFYAFNDDGGETINLILDHNTTGTTYWTNSMVQSSKMGPITALSELKNATSSWNGTIQPTDYTVEQEGYGNYKIPYATDVNGAYKARLITAQEVAKITGAATKQDLMFNENTTSYENKFYFDGLSTSASETCRKGNTIGCQYGWLYDRTSTTCEDYGCYNNNDSGLGYWTGTSVLGDIYSAWCVRYDSALYYDGAYYNFYVGVRPVIEVLKSKVSPGEAPVIPNS